jgi:hypothetical protein
MSSHFGPTTTATLIKLKFGSKMEKFINSSTSYSLRFCLSVVYKNYMEFSQAERFIHIGLNFILEYLSYLKNLSFINDNF